MQRRFLQTFDFHMTFPKSRPSTVPADSIPAWWLSRQILERLESHMARKKLPAGSSSAADSSSPSQAERLSSNTQRRSFLKGLGVVGAALSTGSLLSAVSEAQGSQSVITFGDVAILRFLAAAEI